MWVFFLQLKTGVNPVGALALLRATGVCCGCKREAAFQHGHAQIIQDSQAIMEIFELFYWTFSVLLVGFQLVSFFYLQFSST